MIEKCLRQDREALAPFFHRPDDALLLSALQGYTGRVFVSDCGQSAMAVSRGFVYLAGRADEAFFHEAAQILPAGFLTFSGDPAWLSVARAWGADVEMTRWSVKTPARFDEKALRAMQPPPGFSLRLGGADAYRRCVGEKWSEDMASFFADEGDFLHRGFLAAAYAGERLVSGCGVYALCDGMAEAEIDTHEDFRRQGLALCCGALFLLECVRRGLRPHWDAMNETSLRIALRLGFLPGAPYPVVCREGE